MPKKLKKFDAFTPVFNPEKPWEAVLHPGTGPNSKKAHWYNNPIFEKLSSLRGKTGDVTPYGVGEGEWNEDIATMDRLTAMIKDRQRNINQNLTRIKNDPSLSEALLKENEQYANDIKGYPEQLQKLKDFWNNPYVKALYGGNMLDKPVSVNADGTKVYSDGTIHSPGQWKRTNADGSQIATDYDFSKPFSSDLAGTGYGPQKISDLETATGKKGTSEWLWANPGKTFSDYLAYWNGPATTPNPTVSASTGSPSNTPTTPPIQNPLIPSATPKVQMPNQQPVQGSALMSFAAGSDPVKNLAVQNAYNANSNKGSKIDTSNLLQAYQGQNQSIPSLTIPSAGPNLPSQPKIELPKMFQNNASAPTAGAPNGIKMPNWNGGQKAQGAFGANWDDLLSVAHNRYTR